MHTRYVPKLTRQEMERRRLQAGKDLLACDPKTDWGYQSRIARKYGVSTATANRWDKAARQHGLDALKSTSATGQPRRLSNKQKEKLKRILLDGATARGYETDVWTGKRVAKLIRDEFGATYSEKYVPELLRDQLGFTWQKPARRPRELDPDKVEAWLKNTWEPAKKGRSTASTPSSS